MRGVLILITVVVVAGCGAPAGTLDAAPSDGAARDARAADAMVVDPCGDGILAPPEECDDGNVIAGDGCEPACRLSADVCGVGVTTTPLTPGVAVTGSTVGAPDVHFNGCQEGTAPERVYALPIYTRADVTVTTALPGTSFDTVLAGTRRCVVGVWDQFCRNDPGGGERYTMPDVAPGTYFLFIDGHGGASGTFELLVTVIPAPLPDAGP